jgi:hypothetical protein
VLQPFRLKENRTCRSHRQALKWLEIQWVVAISKKRRLDGSLPLREIMLTETLENVAATQQRPSRLAPLVQRIECEYHEMPGLRLTEAQAQRLWGLDSDTCHIVLVTLIQRRFLRRTATGMYVRAGA